MQYLQTIQCITFWQTARCTTPAREKSNERFTIDLLHTHAFQWGFVDTRDTTHMCYLYFKNVFHVHVLNTMVYVYYA